RAEAAGLEEVGDRITDRHPHDELGHAPLQALVEEVVEQGSAILKPVQIGAQTQVENLPDMRTEGGVFGLDETMDRAVTAVLHHVDVVGRRPPAGCPASPLPSGRRGWPAPERPAPARSPAARG